jgi:hypothetical protein
MTKSAAAPICFNRSFDFAQDDTREEVSRFVSCSSDRRAEEKIPKQSIVCKRVILRSRTRCAGVFAGQDKRSSYLAALYTVILSEVEGSVKFGRRSRTLWFGCEER